MNTIPETAGAFDTPIANIQRQFPRNATTRHQVRTALYQPAHEDGPDPDGHDDKDPDVDQDGFIPINGLLMGMNRIWMTIVASGVHYRLTAPAGNWADVSFSLVFRLVAVRLRRRFVAFSSPPVPCVKATCRLREGHQPKVPFVSLSELYEVWTRPS